MRDGVLGAELRPGRRRSRATIKVGLRDGVLGAELRPGRRRSRATIKVGLRDGGLGVQLAALRWNWGHDVVEGARWRQRGRSRLRGVGAWASPEGLVPQMIGHGGATRARPCEAALHEGVPWAGAGKVARNLALRRQMNHLVVLSSFASCLSLTHRRAYGLVHSCCGSLAALWPSMHGTIWPNSYI